MCENIDIIPQICKDGLLKNIVWLFGNRSEVLNTAAPKVL